MSLKLVHGDVAAIDLEALRRQDAAAFEQLVSLHQPLVLGLAQSLGLGSADQDDAAAETFAAVYRALPRFRGDAELGTWIYRIAWRTMLKVRRRRGRPVAALPADLPGDGDAPDASLDREESSRRLWDAVSRLPAQQAMAVDLYYRHDWPLEQIARTMHCPLGTVKTLLFRARQRLRQRLDEQELRS